MRYILLYFFRVSQRVPSEMLLLGQRYPDKKERNSEIYFIIFLSGFSTGAFRDAFVGTEIP